MEEWQIQLNKHMAGAKNIAVLGIGNEMMGDDAAGALLARELRHKLKNQISKIKIEIFEASTTPENFTGAIRKLQPDLVVMVDAADMDQDPGKIAFLDLSRMHNMMHSTHTLPLSFLAGYLEKIGSAKVIALGIQAGHIKLDQPMTREVAESVKAVARAFAEALCGGQ